MPVEHNPVKCKRRERFQVRGRARPRIIEAINPGRTTYRTGPSTSLAETRQLNHGIPLITRHFIRPLVKYISVINFEELQGVMFLLALFIYIFFTIRQQKPTEKWSGN